MLERLVRSGMVIEDPYALADQAGRTIRDRFGIEGLDSAFVLGSGWSAAADDLGELIGSCELAELPGFAAPTVLGHGGTLRIVRAAAGTTVAVLTGRTHFYETRDVVQVVHGVRAIAAAGANTLVLTNGCGSLNPDWGPGTVVLISDHINLTGASPLRGATFIDLSEAYASRLRMLARGVDPTLPEGVYVQFGGPQFETPAEVRMAGVLGGNLVGMSTALETIAAREAGLEVLGFSLVTNLAAGISAAPLNHQEVLQTGREAAPRLRQLLAGIAAAL
ncbi:MAG TPA: purine-nucleoside phosphorylase [Propionibacteriaceae bacterium]|nr:purine-nucleoside phosphorylase [Propionibacteriaceae bacterium]